MSVGSVKTMSRTLRSSFRDPDVPIAAVERETGLSKDTLRVWERRYGFPLPRRDGRGERVYPPDQVAKLRVLVRLRERGMRPGPLAKIPLEQLNERLRAGDPAIAQGEGQGCGGVLRPALEETFGLLQRYDESGLRAHLSRALMRLGLQRFVTEFAAPLNELVGHAWACGRIAVAQEHIYAEQMQHLLRQGIGSIPPGAQEPSVLLTTLPGEQHQLGLLMAHVCLAAEGARCISLGVQTPPWDIAEAVRCQGIAIVALSFSEALRLSVAYDMLEDLRDRLPGDVEVWAGGKLWTRSRRPVPGVRFITLLAQIPAALAAHTEGRRTHADRDRQSCE
jgi:DNA-binding transcriptional MerR regulator